MCAAPSRTLVGSLIVTKERDLHAAETTFRPCYWVHTGEVDGAANLVLLFNKNEPKTDYTDPATKKEHKEVQVPSDTAGFADDEEINEVNELFGINLRALAENYTDEMKKGRLKRRGIQTIFFSPASNGE